MTNLNVSQEKALRNLCKWWQGPEQYIVLNAAAGYGKSFLVDYFLRSIQADPLILAPTHEALAQVKEKISGEPPPSMTVHASLGIRPTIKEDSVEFREGSLASVWQDINLAIVDESSMLSSKMLDRLMSTGKKILFVGHEAQLPPISEHRKVMETIHSPVFTLDNVPMITLDIPMRNTGSLHEYLTELETLTMDGSRNTNLSSIFDVKKTIIDTYLVSTEGKNELASGQANILAWTNQMVSSYNQKVRRILFGEAAKQKYVMGDRVILTSPVTAIANIGVKTYASILRQVSSADSIHTNTPGTVVCSSHSELKLEGKAYHVTKVTVETIHGMFELYELPEFEYANLATALEHRAWGFSTPKAREKAYRERHEILSCFVKLQHSYAITAHRAQGRTIPTVIVILSDILRNPNRSEAKKCWYTAASRVQKRLMIYKGAQND